VEAGSPVTRTYVLASLRAYPVADADTAFGIDLDGRVGGDVGRCTDTTDYVSAVTGAPGVDDQVRGALSAVDAIAGGDGWDGAIADAIETGVMTIVLEVSEVSGDSCARRVHVWTARTASGTAPEARAQCAASPETACANALDGACYASLTRGTCSGIAPGQRWIAVDDLGEVEGLVAGTRLETNALPRLTLVPVLGPAGTTGAPSPIDLHDVIFEADLHDDVLAHGELGGAIHVTDAVDWVNAHLLPTEPIDVATFDQLFGPDLSPGEHAYDPCADLSAGFGFTAIAATLIH
jgi:hypothetical protein